MTKVTAQFEGSHDQHMEGLIRDWLLLNLREYVQAATAVNGNSNLVFARLMNLQVALNAFFDHAVKGNGKQTLALCQSHECVMINRELSNGVRHYVTDRGRLVTSHSARREREIIAGEQVPTQALFNFQVPVQGGEVNVNEVVAGTLAVMLQEAGHRGWIKPEQRQEFGALITQVWPTWTGQPEGCQVSVKPQTS